jgi:hypothetical protein
MSKLLGELKRTTPVEVGSNLRLCRVTTAAWGGGGGLVDSGWNSLWAFVRQIRLGSG